MIEFTKSYKVGDQVFATLTEAQAHELGILSASSKDVAQFITFMVQNPEKVIDILSTTTSSRPKARKANGGTKKRKVIRSADVIAAANQ